MSRHSLFVLGGARSGKSRYAQSRAEAVAGRHIFVATAQAYDDEMRERIARHRSDRDARWQTVEAPHELAAAIHAANQPEAVLLIDCLTLWLSNLMFAEADVEAAVRQLCAAIDGFEGYLILVANDVGLGIVPDNALARRFRDEAGRANQAVAKVAAEVQIVFAGLPQRLK